MERGCDANGKAWLGLERRASGLVPIPWVVHGAHVGYFAGHSLLFASMYLIPNRVSLADFMIISPTHIHNLSLPELQIGINLYSLYRLLFRTRFNAFSRPPSLSLVLVLFFLLISLFYSGTSVEGSGVCNVLRCMAWEVYFRAHFAKTDELERSCLRFCV